MPLQNPPLSRDCSSGATEEDEFLLPSSDEYDLLLQSNEEVGEIEEGDMMAGAEGGD